MNFYPDIMNSNLTYIYVNLIFEILSHTCLFDGSYNLK